MTDEVSLMMQAAAVQALLNDMSVTALVGDRVYDDVPPNPTFPYISWGDDGTNDDGSDCVVGSEVFFSLHVWSKAVGKPQAKRIAGVVRNCLDEAALSVTGYHLVTLHHRITRWPNQPDGVIKHGVVTFRALLDEI